LKDREDDACVEKSIGQKVCDSAVGVLVNGDREKKNRQSDDPFSDLIVFHQRSPVSPAFPARGNSLPLHGISISSMEQRLKRLTKEEI
jgi:hypothetical protein